MRVTEHSSSLRAVHGPLHCVGVCALALRRQLLLAEETVSASDLERGNVAAADFDGIGIHGRPDLIDDAAELVAENVALGHLDYGAVEQVEVGAADSAASNTKNYITVFDNLGPRNVI
jgi:hypothetical protein